MRGSWIVIAIVCGILTVATTARARSFVVRDPTPYEVIESRLLSTDADKLIEYLTEGIPPEHVVSGSLGYQFSPSRRFGCYFAAIDILSEQDVHAAAPILRQYQAGKFPSVVRADLDVYVGVLNEWPSWEHWDVAVRLEQDDLRLRAALALAKITSESPIPVLYELLQSWQPAVTGIPMAAPQPAYFGLFLEICDHMLAAGDKRGIGALIEFLNPNAIDPSYLAARLLTDWTGENFGPEESDTPYIAAREIEKWRDWWSTHRETFQPDPTLMAALEKTPCTPVVALRDRLDYASGEYTDCEEYYSSQDWLESNAQTALSELRAVLDDPNEHPRIRAEALNWYSRHASDGLATLDRYTRDASVLQSKPVLDAIMYVTGNFYPDNALRLSKSIIETWPHHAEHVLFDLTTSPESIEFLRAHFDSFNPNAQGLIIEVLRRKGNVPTTMVESALQGPDFLAAVYATLAVETLGLQLSPAALEALGRWRQKPRYLLARVRGEYDQGANPNAFINVAQAIHSEDPNAAHLLFRLDRSAITSIQRKEIVRAERAHFAAIRKTCFFGILRSVQTYRDSRGRTDPLPKYAF